MTLWFIILVLVIIFLKSKSNSLESAIDDYQTQKRIIHLKENNLLQEIELNNIALNVLPKLLMSLFASLVLVFLIPFFILFSIDFFFAIQLNYLWTFGLYIAYKLVK